ncbi:MAG TPA: response regulator [Paucimonas sp.]|nr:response regulator [Paucimonas sp.]
MTDPSKEFLDRLLATFRAEAEEHLQNIVAHTVLLEQAQPATQPKFADPILKRLHTLKGAARAVGLAGLETLCHAMESVFSAMRESGNALSPGQFDVVHQACAFAPALFSEPSGRTRNQASVLIGKLERLSDALRTAEDNLPPPPPAAALDAPAAAAETEPALAETAETVDAAKADTVKVQGRCLDAIRYQTEALLAVELGLRHQLSDLLSLADELSGQQVQKTRDAEARCRRLAGALNATHRELSAIRAKLLDATLESALVPFASALDQLHGMVRNLARGSGKEAMLSVQGEAIQIDRRILQILREALVHLVTNAVDHGLETAETRLARGKPASGEVSVKVAPRGSNQISVIVADDGAGIDVTAVVNAAIESGRLTKEQLAGLSEQQRLYLALFAGVSTRREVTRVSGRGVGLAIVAEKIASIGGELLIENAPERGCSFELRMPVRLTMMKGLIVLARGNRYAIPLFGVEAARSLREGDIQTVENRETLEFDGRVVPAIRLDRLLGLERGTPAAGGEEDIALIVRAGRHVLALLVDDILGEQEILPKSLGKQLRRVRFVLGVTQLGDGCLVPLLSLEDIVRHGLTAASGASVSDSAEDRDDGTRRVLVVEDSITSRLLLKHILEGAGYRVETAADGLDALPKLRHGKFDAVVSDIEMPLMDGLELTGEIRRTPSTEHLPVVLVTSRQSPEERAQGLRAGADAYVAKGSFDQDNLLAALRRLI